MAAEKRRQFTREFKLEAVRLLHESGRPAAQVARELGVRLDMLRRWRDEAEGSAPADLFPGTGHLPPAEAELRRLRRELEEVKQENLFLKKAAAYFAKESRRSTP